MGEIMRWVSQNRKMVTFVAVLAILAIMIVISVLNPPPGPRPLVAEWEELMKPAADEFLMLLEEGDIDTLIDRYCEYSVHGRGEIKELIEKSQEKIGRLESFDFSSSTSIGFPEKYTLLMSYNGAFSSGKKYDMVFSADIDAETNQPIPGRLERFEIRGNYGVNHLDIVLFYLKKYMNEEAKAKTHRRSDRVHGQVA